MTARFKLVAAVLGLAVATAAIGDASATTTIVKSAGKTAAQKTAAHKIIAHKTTVAHAPHRVIVGKHLVRHVGPHLRIVHRAPAVVKVVRPAASTTTVRIAKRPMLHKQLVAHRVTVRKTIIR